jgi:hypothetical protein
VNWNAMANPVIVTTQLVIAKTDLLSLIVQVCKTQNFPTFKFFTAKLNIFLTITDPHCKDKKKTKKCIKWKKKGKCGKKKIAKKCKKTCNLC